MRLVFKRKQKQNVTTAAIVNFFSLSLSRVCCLGIEPRRIDRKCNLASQQKQKHITHLHPHATHTHIQQQTPLWLTPSLLLLLLSLLLLRCACVVYCKIKIEYFTTFLIRFGSTFSVTHTHTRRANKNNWEKLLSAFYSAQKRTVESS